MVSQRPTPDEITRLENRTVFGEWSQFRGRSSRSLRRASLLSTALGLPEVLRDIPLLGVVGSKGKGTAAIYASAALASGGLKVGTILSPGVISNRDRFRLNGRNLDDDDYVSVLSRIGDARATLPPIDPEDGYLSPVGSFLMGGLDFLARAGCDVIVAEAGIGGASDELSLFALDTVVVTGVFGEHLDLLGPTVIDVARNKSAVITEATRSVFTLPQPAEIRDVIVARCESVAAELTVVGDAPIDRELFPPGFSGINARLGTTAGSSLAEAIVGEPPEDEALRATVRSVSYPGRLSVHPFGSGRVVVDSAVSRDGLVSALAFAAEALDGPPPQILVSLPREKDLGGFIEELRDVAARRVFVGLTTHLQYPDRDEWPWEWADVRDLPALLASGDTLAIGTVSFSAEVLRVLGVNADVLFASPDRPGRKPLP